MEQINRAFPERVLRDMDAAVLVLGQKGNIVYVNEPAACMLDIEQGLRQDGEHFRMITDSDYNDRFNEVIFNALAQKDGTSYEKVPYMAPSGKKYVFMMSCSYLKESEPEGAELIITLTDKTEEERIRDKFNDSSITFTVFLFGFCGWILFYALWEFLRCPFPADYMTIGVELLGLLMFGFVWRFTDLTWHDIGTAMKSPRRTVGVALIVAAGSFVFLCALKAVIRIFNPGAFGPGLPFVDFRLFGVRQLRYIFTAGVQEFLARSVMQENLRRITPGRHTGALAIVLSSLIFAGLHIHFGFLFMMGAAILAGLEGILYDKQRNIYGVWIVHWVFGVSGTLLRLIDH